MLITVSFDDEISPAGQPVASAAHRPAAAVMPPPPSRGRLLNLVSHLHADQHPRCSRSIAAQRTAADWGDSLGWQAEGTGGAVAAGGAGAVAAGLKILEQGGNAADAAAATLLGLAITDYGNTSIGGEIPVGRCHASGGQQHQR